MIDITRRGLAALAAVALAGCGSGGGGAPQGGSPVVEVGDFGGGYRNAHYRDDGTTLLEEAPVAQVTVPIDLSGPMSGPGTLSYALAGDAVRGLHFEVAPGSASPLQLPKGATSAAVRLVLDPQGLRGTRWFRERLCSVTLTGGTNLSLAQPREFRLWIRSTAPVPRLAFEHGEGSGGSAGNPHAIGIVQSGLSEERTTVHYTLGGTAVEGQDYTIAPGSESGELTILPGQTGAALELDVDPAADGSGKTIVVELDHEAHDRSEENLWTFTHEWSLDALDPDYAAQPSDHAAGGGELTKNAPERELGLEIVRQDALEPKRAPDGHLLQGIVQSAFIGDVDFYIRESFENQYYCGGPTKLFPLPAAMRVSVYVETFLPPDDWRNSTFVKLNLRNRVKDVNHAVVFRRGETADEVREDWRGDSSWGEPVETPTGWWGLWHTFQLESPVWGRDFGVAAEPWGGALRTRLWQSHFADGTTVYVNAGGEEVTEELGEDLMNPILRFTYFTKGDGSWDLTGGPVENRGRGLLAYWPMLEVGEERFHGPPGRFWEKRRRFWEPRGNACRDLDGATDFTFTIQ